MVARHPCPRPAARGVGRGRDTRHRRGRPGRRDPLGAHRDRAPAGGRKAAARRRARPGARRVAARLPGRCREAVAARPLHRARRPVAGGAVPVSDAGHDRRPPHPSRPVAVHAEAGSYAYDTMTLVGPGTPTCRCRRRRNTTVRRPPSARRSRALLRPSLRAQRAFFVLSAELRRCCRTVLGRAEPLVELMVRGHVLRACARGLRENESRLSATARPPSPRLVAPVRSIRAVQSRARCPRRGRGCRRSPSGGGP